jgi:hypothetical protein
MKLVTKVSPLTAKATIMEPRVSTPALMCFGSITNLHLPHKCAEAKDMPNPKEIVIHNLYNVLWKVPLNCWTYLCRNACSHALHRRLRRSGVKETGY